LKTLFLIRHAKSSWDDPQLADSERPLNDRGRHDAKKMSLIVAKRLGRPDTMLSSPAVRARATAGTFAEALGFAVHDVVLLDRLYAANAATVLDVIESLSDRVKTAMVFGHNPGFTDLAKRLSPGIGEMPTCAVLELAFDTKTWSAIRTTPPRTVTLDSPKRL
jgi:phosphohistidine phosphatase